MVDSASGDYPSPEAPRRPITSSIEGVAFPTVSRHGNRLAYQVFTGHATLWRMELSPGHPPAASEPKRFIYSSRDDGQPIYSRDGKNIAFASNRAGPLEIWVAKADGSDPVQLTD